MTDDAYRITDAERRRRSQRARRLVREGRFGGAEFGKLGGRPRKASPLTTVVAAQVREHADVIAERMLRIVREGDDLAAVEAAGVLARLADVPPSRG